MKQSKPIDPAEFIRNSMKATPVTGLPGISLYAPHAGSGLGRLLAKSGDRDAPPYWAYRWAGGLALAHHLVAHPEMVAGRRVLDLGAGSGLVAIAAAKAGAATVVASEIDANGKAAIQLNAELNAVTMAAIVGDLTQADPPAVDIVLVGDLFYDAALAETVLGFLDRCLAAGIAVLVGDPWRTHLPRSRLMQIAEYAVADVGDPEQRNRTASAIFALLPPA